MAGFSLLIAMGGKMIESVGIEQRTYDSTNDRDGEHSLHHRTVAKNRQENGDTLINSGS